MKNRSGLYILWSVAGLCFVSGVAILSSEGGV